MVFKAGNQTNLEILKHNLLILAFSSHLALYQTKNLKIKIKLLT